MAPGCLSNGPWLEAPYQPEPFRRCVTHQMYPPHKHRPMLMPPCFTTRKSKCKACKEKPPTPIQKQTMDYPGKSRIYPFCFPIVIPITVWMTGRWGWEKGEQQMFPNICQAVWKMFHIWEGNHSCMNCSSSLIPIPTENWRKP